MATKEQIDDIRGLVISGDVNLEEYKDYYLQIVGKPTILTDEQLIEMVAESEDDDDPEGWVVNMKSRELVKT